ncbi:MAG: hypothetical protein KA155_07095 [Alphaproteobacteria bacterium]|jgi:hypothetical protein|nr:hypothetical protein [Alphaproteobacteria bacterium]
MNRSEYVLAVMALLGRSTSLTPAKIQKLFFILDREIPGNIQGPRFNFTAYDYGPFDATVYQEIEGLEIAGLALIERGNPHKIYKLSDAGFERGEELSQGFTPEIREYIQSIGTLVQSLSFQGLVSTIYQNYPEMRARSVFRE